MKILISVLSIVLLMLSACATTDAKSSSSSVTTAQSKALSKINNVKGNHSSVNGAGLNGQSITTMATDCYKHEFTMNFDGNYTPPQKINCEEDIDFSSFENDSLKLFRSTALGASKRSDNTGKQMVFYMGMNTAHLWLMPNSIKMIITQGPEFLIMDHFSTTI